MLLDVQPQTVVFRNSRGTEHPPSHPRFSLLEVTEIKDNTLTVFKDNLAGIAVANGVEDHFVRHFIVLSGVLIGLTSCNVRSLEMNI